MPLLLLSDEEIAQQAADEALHDRMRIFEADISPPDMGGQACWSLARYIPRLQVYTILVRGHVTPEIYAAKYKEELGEDCPAEIVRHQWGRWVLPRPRSRRGGQNHVRRKAEPIRTPGWHRRRHVRTGRRKKDENFGDLNYQVRRLPCCVLDCDREPVEAVYVKPHGSGGHAWVLVEGVEAGNLVPLCEAYSAALESQRVAEFESAHLLVVRLPERPSQAFTTLTAIARVVGLWVKAGPC
jgi:hypothetical protein